MRCKLLFSLGYLTLDINLAPYCGAHYYIGSEETGRSAAYRREPGKRPKHAEGGTLKR
jgi:hypothetical protein